MSKAEGKKISIKFTQSLVGDVTGNTSAFSITGQEYKWLDGQTYNGSLISKTYIVSAVQMHPTEPNSILLEVAGFRNVQGSLSISYNQTLGTLAGAGGVVESFTKTFTPIDLIEGLTDSGGSVGVHDHIGATIGGTVELKYITRIPAYAPEFIGATVGGAIQLIHIDDINP